MNSRISGSAALDLAYVGSGRLDGYYQKSLNIWDIAAGILIVKEAGGKTNNLSLKETVNIDLIASSESIYENMTKKLNKF